jgi:hypothetical protein
MGSPQKCPQCNHKEYTVGYVTDTSVLDDMSPDLRILLADFAMVLCAKYPKNSHQVWEYMVEYTKWLSIIKDVPDDPNTIYSPPEKIDEIWHLHILCTKNYAAVCGILCGQLINHRLVFESADARTIRLEATIKALRRFEHFNENTANIWGIPLQSPAYNLAPLGTVYVRSLSGRTVSVDYHPKYTIGDLLIKLDMCVTGTGTIFQGRTLNTSKTCEDYNISNGHTLHSVLKLSGC